MARPFVRLIWIEMLVAENLLTSIGGDDTGSSSGVSGEISQPVTSLTSRPGGKSTVLLLVVTGQDRSGRDETYR